MTSTLSLHAGVLKLVVFTLFQLIIAPIFLLLAVVEAYRVFRRAEQHGRIYWMLIWVCGFGFVVAPTLLQRMALLVGIGRGTDLLLYGLAMAFLFVTWRQTVKTEELRRDLTELVRMQAIMEAKRGIEEKQLVRPPANSDL